MVLGKLDSHVQKNETRPFSYTIHKDKPKMDERSNARQEFIKILEKNTGNTLFELGHSNFLQDTSMMARETKAKNELLGLNQDKKLLHSKRNSQQGIPGWRSGLAPAFGPGHDPGDPGSNPTSGSRCMEPASPSACVSASLSLSLSL